MASKTKIDVIHLTAQVWAIKTTVDGGVNVTLAISGKCINEIAMLLECKEKRAILEIAAVPISPQKANQNNVGKQKKRSQRYPYK